MVTLRKSGGLSETWALAIYPNCRKISLGLGSCLVVTLAMARDRALANARVASLRPRPSHWSAPVARKHCLCAIGGVRGGRGNAHTQGFGPDRCEADRRGGT